MKMDMTGFLVMAAVIGVVTVTGCGKKDGPEGVGTPGAAERAGAALDTAKDKTVEATKNAAAATKDAAGRVVEKTGEVLEKAGAATEDAGARMQK